MWLGHCWPMVWVQEEERTQIYSFAKCANLQNFREKSGRYFKLDKLWQNFIPPEKVMSAFVSIPQWLQSQWF